MRSINTSFGWNEVRILALETTEMTGSVAAADGGKLLVQKDLDPGQRTAQSLVPGMRAALEDVGWRPPDVDLVAVTIGPGSFTGLRIGVATAKTFAYAVGAEVLGIDTLEAIAAAAPPQVDALAVAVDAQRGQVIAGPFRRHEDGWMRPSAAAELVDTEAWLESLPAGTIVSGPIIRKFVDKLPQGVTAIDRQLWRPQAAMVAQLAHRDYASGRRDDLWKLLPYYSRLSAAEEKLRGGR